MITRKTPIASKPAHASTPQGAAAPSAVAPAVDPAPSPAPSPTPDPNAALEAYVQQTVQALDALEQALGADPPLSPKDKLHAPKLRKGGAKTVSQIGSLATQNQLESAALPVAVMLGLLCKADALRPLAARLAAFTTHVADQIFAAQSSAWDMAMQYYALLQRRARAEAELAAALEPIAQFFAYRHPSKKAPVGSPTKRQRRAAAKAKRTLKTVAGGKLANTDASGAVAQSTTDRNVKHNF
jgi:hypothetical protein